MYPNFEAEKSRISLTNIIIADYLNIDPSTLSAWLNTESKLKLCEAKKIRDKFFPELQIDYLFSTDIQMGSNQ